METLRALHRFDKKKYSLYGSPGVREVKNSPPTFSTLTTEFKNIARSHSVGGHKSSMLWLCYFNNSVVAQSKSN